MSRKRRCNRPWIEDNIVSDNKNRISKVVRVLCRSSNTGYGSFVKVVTDGELKIVAAFSEEAVQSALNDLDGEDNPCWNTALLILHEFSIELRTLPRKDYGEYILYVEKFNIWDLQPGYQAKYDFKYCMENEKIWDKMMAVYAARKEKRFNSAADTSNTGSVSLTQLLDEMAAPSLDIQLSYNDAEHTVGIISDSLREKLCAPFTVEEFLISKENLTSLDQINEWKPDYQPQSSSENKLSSDDILQGNLSYCQPQVSLQLEDKQSQKPQSVGKSSIEPVREVSPVGLSQSKPSNSLSQEGSQWQEGLDSVRFSFEAEDGMSSPEHASPVLRTSLFGQPTAHSTQRDCIPSTSVVDDLQSICKVLLITNTSDRSSESLENSHLTECTEMQDDNESAENSSSECVSPSDSDKLVMEEYYSVEKTSVKVRTTEARLRNRELLLHNKKEKLEELLKAVDNLPPFSHINKRLDTCNENHSCSKCETQIGNSEVSDRIQLSMAKNVVTVSVEGDKHIKEKESPVEDLNVGDEAESGAQTKEVDVSNNLSNDANDGVDIGQVVSSLHHPDENYNKKDEENSDKNIKNDKIISYINYIGISAISYYMIHNSDKTCVAERCEIVDSSEQSGVSTSVMLNSEDVPQGTDNTLGRSEKRSPESSETLYSSSATSGVNESDICTPETQSKQLIQDNITHSEAMETDILEFEEADGKCKKDTRVRKLEKDMEQVINKQHNSGASNFNISSEKERKGETGIVSVKGGGICEVESENKETSNKEKAGKWAGDKNENVDSVEDVLFQTVGSAKDVCSVNTATNKEIGEQKDTLLSSSKSNSSDNANKHLLKSSTKLVIDDTVQVSKRRSLRLKNKEMNPVTESNELPENTEVMFVDAGKKEEINVNPIKNTSTESSMPSFASTTVERIDEKLKRKEKILSKLSKTNKRKFLFKKVDADNYEDKVGAPYRDIFMENPNTTVDNKNPAVKTNVPVHDSKPSVTKACDKKWSQSGKTSLANTSHDNMFPKRDKMQKDPEAKNHKNIELNNRENENYGKNDECEGEKLCIEPDKETLSEETNTHSPIFNTQPFDIAMSEGTQAFTPKLSESPKSDLSSNELFVSDDEKDIGYKKADCEPASDDKVGVIENLHECDARNTVQSFTKIIRKPILETTDKPMKKYKGKSDHSECSSSSESVIFSEPQPKHVSKRNVILNLESRSGVDRETRLECVKEKVIGPKSMFRVKGIQRKRKSAVVRVEGDQIKKKLKYTATEPGSDSDCALIEDKTPSDVDDVVPEVSFSDEDRTPRKQGQLKYGTINGQFRFYRDSENVNQTKPIETSDCRHKKVNEHLLKTPDRKSRNPDDKALKTPEPNEKKQERNALKTPDKTVCGKCTYDVPVVICKKMTPRKIYTETPELDKKIYVEDWLMKHKKIGAPIQPEGSQEWALNLNQSAEEVKNQSDNFAKNQMNRSDEDLFDFSDFSDESGIINNDLNRNKIEGKHKMDIGLKQSCGKSTAVCGGKSKVVGVEIEKKVQTEHEPLSAVDMYFKKFEML